MILLTISLSHHFHNFLSHQTQTNISNNLIHKPIYREKQRSQEWSRRSYNSSFKHTNQTSSRSNTHTQIKANPDELKLKINTYIYKQRDRVRDRKRNSNWNHLGFWGSPLFIFLWDCQRKKKKTTTLGNSLLREFRRSEKRQKTT